ncbi:MAG: hypothetical protein GXP49_10680 [Deltaproteobacteria bacterium]|nr:hypothetical protein [Deltaproteobacteria bacterium]
MYFFAENNKIPESGEKEEKIKMARRKKKKKNSFPALVEEKEKNTIPDLKSQDAEFLEAMRGIDIIRPLEKFRSKAKNDTKKNGNGTVGDKILEQDAELFQRAVHSLDQHTIESITREKDLSEENFKKDGFRARPVRSRLSRTSRPGTELDLHGMHKAEAIPLLRSFLDRARKRKERVVLVITGYGKHSDMHGPVLKEAVETWVKDKEGSQLVSEIYTAPQEDGGPGAFYLFLKPLEKI